MAVDQDFTNAPLPPLITVEDFYKTTGRRVGVGTIRKLVRDGYIYSVRVGRRYLIPRAELERLPEALAEAAREGGT